MSVALIRLLSLIFTFTLLAQATIAHEANVPDYFRIHLAMVDLEKFKDHHFTYSVKSLISDADDSGPNVFINGKTTEENGDFHNEYNGDVNGYILGAWFKLTRTPIYGGYYGVKYLVTDETSHTVVIEGKLSPSYIHLKHSGIDIQEWRSSIFNLNEHYDVEETNADECVKDEDLKYNGPVSTINLYLREKYFD